MTDLDTLARGHAEFIQEEARLHQVPAPDWVGHGSPKAPKTPRWLVPVLAGIASLLVLALTGLIRFSADDPVDVATTVPTTTPSTVPATKPSTRTPLFGNGKIVIALGNSMSVVVPPDSVETPAVPGLATRALQAMTWSSDGERVAGVEEDGTVVVFDPVSGSVEAEIESVASRACFCSVDWSPDGSSIVIDDGLGSLFLIDTSRWVAEPVDIDGYDGTVGDPSFSPDGEWIAVTYFPDEGANGVAKVRPNGTEFTSLFETRTLAEPSGFSSVDWSPVFDEIAVLFFEPVGEGTEKSVEVGLVGGHGSGYRTLTDAGRCSCLGYRPGVGWSPDGTMLALNIPLPTANEAALWVIAYDGSALEKVSTIVGSGDPAWQPAPTG